MATPTLLPQDLEPATAGATACDHLAELAATRTKFQTFLTWMYDNTGAIGAFKTWLLEQLFLLDTTMKGWFLRTNATTGKVELVEKIPLTGIAQGGATDGQVLVWDADAIDSTHGAWVPRAAEYTSAESPVPAPLNGGKIEATHGLGYTPTNYRAILVCLGPDLDYVEGDTVNALSLMYFNGTAEEVQQGATVCANATKVWVTFRNGSSSPSYQLQGNATFGRGDIDVLNWNVKLVAS